jgi:hypothetical protein
MGRGPSALLPEPSSPSNSDRRSTAICKLFPTGPIFQSDLRSPATELVSSPIQVSALAYLFDIHRTILNPLRSDVLECPACFRSSRGFAPFGMKAFSQFSLPEIPFEIA